MKVRKTGKMDADAIGKDIVYLGWDEVIFLRLVSRICAKHYIGLPGPSFLPPSRNG
jgi:hypothetical protein